MESSYSTSHGVCVCVCVACVFSVRVCPVCVRVLHVCLLVSVCIGCVRCLLRCRHAYVCVCAYAYVCTWCDRVCTCVYIYMSVCVCRKFYKFVASESSSTDSLNEVITIPNPSWALLTHKVSVHTHKHAHKHTRLCT